MALHPEKSVAVVFPLGRAFLAPGRNPEVLKEWERSVHSETKAGALLMLPPVVMAGTRGPGLGGVLRRQDGHGGKAQGPGLRRKNNGCLPWAWASPVWLASSPHGESLSG